MNWDTSDCEERGQVNFLNTPEEKPYTLRLLRLMALGKGPIHAESMARLPRLDLAGIPQHIVQRGNNRLPCFLDDDDRQRYLQLLRQAALATQSKTGVRVHFK